VRVRARAFVMMTGEGVLVMKLRSLLASKGCGIDDEGLHQTVS